MVVLKDNCPRFTAEEYFAWEEQQLYRQEYIDGEVYAMSGGTINHSEIASKFNRLIGNHLDGSGCRTLNSIIIILLDQAIIQFHFLFLRFDRPYFQSMLIFSKPLDDLHQSLPPC
jgi:Uma2 family endonuclease